MTEETSHCIASATGKTHARACTHTHVEESSLELITITMQSSTTVIAENRFY